MAWNIPDLENNIAFTIHQYNEDYVDYSAVEDLLADARMMGYNWDSKLKKLVPIKTETMYNSNNRNNYGNRNQNWNGNRGGNRQQDQTKKSGATYTKMKAGKYAGMYAVNAWRKTKAGLMVAKGFPVSDVEHQSEKGNFFVRYAVEVSMPSAGTSQTYWCLMNTKTQKLVIKELSLVISPNGQGYTASGKRVSGFFGANFKRR